MLIAYARVVCILCLDLVLWPGDVVLLSCLVWSCLCSLLYWLMRMLVRLVVPVNLLMSMCWLTLSALWYLGSVLLVCVSVLLCVNVCVCLLL